MSLVLLCPRYQCPYRHEVSEPCPPEWTDVPSDDVPSDGGDDGWEPGPAGRRLEGRGLAGARPVLLVAAVDGRRGGAAVTNVDAATAYWDAVQVGDPMPPWEETDDGRCWAPSPPDPVTSYVCGRPLGHAGQHVAPAPYQIVATWRTS